MRSLFLRRLALVVVASPALARGQELRTESPRVSAYDMAVTLDPAAKRISGTQRIRWRNDVGAPTAELRFHLYLNAFADRASTFMVEAGAEFRDLWRAGDFGGCDLQRLELVEGDDRLDLTGGIRFVSPDDGNAADRTVAVVALPRPVPPGGEVVVETRFESRLPRAHRRTGWVPGDGFFCMHWFPKLGVLEATPAGAVWSCHQFHANSEFFADFSTYRVAITLPTRFVVGATGGNPESESFDGERKTLRFVQDDVHDFAFVADPDFVRIDDTFGPFAAADDPSGVAAVVAVRQGVAVSTFDLPRTAIVLLLRPEHRGQAERHLEAIKVGLRFFGLRYGPYPYPVITAVDPGRDLGGRSLGGGMEYPMLITCGTTLFPHPRRQAPEGVTVHEFGHQYWYGLSANDEFQESWLDEGINTFSESRAQLLHYGPKMVPVQTTSIGLLTFAATPAIPATVPRHGLADLGRLPLWRLPETVRRPIEARGFRGTVMPDSPLLDMMRTLPTATFAREARFDDHLADRSRYLEVDHGDAMVQPGWEYSSHASYGVNSYTRPATLLNTLERLVGRDRFWDFMRRFHARARFRHPTTADFEAALAAACGPEAAAFFAAATRGDGVFDYGITAVEPAAAPGETNLVTVRRRGSVTADVRVRFTFAGRGEPEWALIEAGDAGPWYRFRFPFAEFGALTEAWVDPPVGTPADGAPFEAPCAPAGVYLIDANLVDNAWRAASDRRPAIYRGLRMWLQAMAELSFAGLIG